MKKKFQWWQVDAPSGFTEDSDYQDYQWCLTTMGQPDYTARWWYESSSDKFYFRQQKDAMLFELMWSNHEQRHTET